MAYYSNKFLGSSSSGFVNDGTYDMNVNSVQVQNLSPNELVATDANKNLISVPYPTSMSYGYFIGKPQNNTDILPGINVPMDIIMKTSNNLQLENERLIIFLSAGAYSIDIIFSFASVGTPILSTGTRLKFYLNNIEIENSGIVINSNLQGNV